MSEPSAISAATAAPLIAVEHVYKSVTDSTGTLDILLDIDFQLAPRETVAIVGASGSGKSTLLSIIAGLDTPTRGTVRLAGQDLFALDEDGRAALRAQKIGFVFQSFNLLPRMTVFENVELPMVYAGVPKGERKIKTEEALRKVGLLEWAKHRPNEISGGQKQRVSIARAICNDPSVIMADEPTGNLDSKSALDIMEIFQKLNDEGRTIIMITHEKENIQYFKRVVSFRDGEIEEDREVHDRKVLSHGERLRAEESSLEEEKDSEVQPTEV